MAFPTLVSSSVDGSRFAKQQPFRSSAGNIYVPVGLASGGISMFKATDPTSSFSAVDDSNKPATSIFAMNVTNNGDIIYIVGHNTSNIIQFHAFSMSSDTWTTTDETVADVSGMSAPTSRIVTIAYRGATNDELAVGYQSTTDNIMGTDYARLDIMHKDVTASTWTGPISLDDAGETHYNVPHSVVGSSNGTHYSYVVSGTWSFKTLDSSNSLSTAVTISSSNFNAVQVGVSFDDSGTQRIAFLSNFDSSGVHVAIASEDGSGNISSPSEVAVSDSNAAFGARIGLVWESGTTIHALWPDSGDNDIMQDVSTNSGSTWGTDTDVESSVTAADIGANIYNSVIGYVYTQTGTGLVYNEFTLSGGSTTPKTLTHSATGTSVIALDINYALTMPVTSVATSNIVKSAGKILATTSTATAANVKSVGKNIAIIASGAVALVASFLYMVTSNVVALGTAGFSKLYQPIFNAAIVATGTSSVVKSVGKTLAIISTGAANIVKDITLSIFAVTSVVTSNLVKSAGKTLANVSTAVSAIVRDVTLSTFAVTSVAVSNIVKDVTLNAFAITSVATSNIVKSVGKPFAIVSTEVVNAIVSLSYFVTPSIVAVGTALMSKTHQFLFSASVLSTEVINLTKSVGKTLAVSAMATVGIVKGVGKILANTAIGTATTVTSFNFLVGANMTAIGVAALSKLSSYSVILVNTAIGSADIIIGVIEKTSSVISIAVIGMTKQISKTIAITATGTMSIVKGLFKTLTHSGVGTAGNTTQKIDGSPAEGGVDSNVGAWYRYFSRRNKS